jgi:broad specificity phosphatase PhoE
MATKKERAKAKRELPHQPSKPAKVVLLALLRACNTARRLAKLHGTPIVYMKNGKIIEEYP